MTTRSSKDEGLGFSLRSGRSVPFRDDPGILAELKNAILDDSFRKVSDAGQDPLDEGADRVCDEIVTEVDHVVQQLPESYARALLIDLLSDDVLEHMLVDLAQRARRADRLAVEQAQGQRPS